jgi:hypothetical protein
LLKIDCTRYLETQKNVNTPLTRYIPKNLKQKIEFFGMLVIVLLFKHFFFLTFLESILPPRQIDVFKISLKFSIFVPLCPVPRKKTSLSEGSFS